MAQDNSQQKTWHERTESIEGLVRQIESLGDPAARAACTALVQSLMEFHASGLERILDIVYESGEAGMRVIDLIASDEVAGTLLLLHSLHPLDLQTRVLQGLEKAKPYLRSHGGNVELVEITDTGAVTLRLEGSCQTCPSSSATLKSTVEEAIYAAAPDVTAIVVEEAEQSVHDKSGFVPLTQIQPMRSAFLPLGEFPEEVEGIKLAAIASTDSGAD